MYSALQIAAKYLKYYLQAENSRGHGVHSPFVFDFIVHVLNQKVSPAEFQVIESYRKRLLRDHRLIQVQDFGAGSAMLSEKERKLSDIASASLKNQKYARLLFRIARYYGCRNMVELGTSLGTTTAYLAQATEDGHVTTFEGADRIADVAEDFFHTAGLQNIELIRGNFSDTLPVALHHLAPVDLLFVDGNHQEVPTWQYFLSFLDRSHNDSIFIFDDIHWSEGMERAWERIREHPAVTMTIDLFFIGLVFFKKEFLKKQHFVLRF